MSRLADGRFGVHSTNLLSGTSQREVFDCCVVASGHYSTPNVPSFAGIASFPGRVLHAHDFRSAREFAGQRVLCVGASYSAEDIGSQLLKYGARSVSFSYRTRPMRFLWPADRCSTHALLERVEGARCHFSDGTSSEFDAIVLCTGYLNAYPFMDRDLALVSRNRLFPPNLYNGVAWTGCAGLFYLGMQDQYYTFNMFDAQAWYVRDVMLGRAQLPSREEMESDSTAWMAREQTVSHYTEAIDFQTDYVQSLMLLSDYPTFDIGAVSYMFKQWEQHKTEGILTFRDRYGFKSVITGCLSPQHHTPWIEALDDSLETFIGAKS
jgi:trimethylamine monooxygenase